MKYFLKNCCIIPFLIGAATLGSCSQPPSNVADQPTEPTHLAKFATQSSTAPAASETSIGGVSADKQVVTSKQTYATNEGIAVQFNDLPGNQQDWITIVPASDPDDTYNEWFYTKGQQSGSYWFKGLPVGEYEVRAYHNWPDGGYVVQDRHRFQVSGSQSQPDNPNRQTVSAHKTTYIPNEPIVVTYANLPGNQQDWITIVEASKPDNTYGEWFYTKGQRTGSYQFKGLPAGRYEVRVYHNWPDGDYVVKGRYGFRVSN